MNKKHIGRKFDDFLKEENILEQVQAAAITPDDTEALMLTDSVHHGGIMFGLAVPLMNRQRDLTGAMVLLSSRPSEKALLSFIGAIIEYPIASVLLHEQNNLTLAVGSKLFLYEQKYLWGDFAAAAVLSGLPITLVFLAAQRWIVSGLTAGGVKE